MSSTPCPWVLVKNSRIGAEGMLWGRLSHSGKRMPCIAYFFPSELMPLFVHAAPGLLPRLHFIADSRLGLPIVFFNIILPAASPESLVLPFCTHCCSWNAWNSALIWSLKMRVQDKSSLLLSWLNLTVVKTIKINNHLGGPTTFA